MIAPSDLTAAERAVARAVPRGLEVDLRAAGPASPGAGAPVERTGPPGAGASAERTVRASVLRAVLLGGARPVGEVPALRLAGARVSGVLDLANATVDCPVRFRDCTFDEPPDLHAARTRQINLTGSVFPGITAAGIRMDGALHLTGCHSTGEIRLAGARIAGALLMEGARLESGTGEVLLLDPAHIANDLWAPGLRAYGRIRLAGAELGGALNLEDAVLDDPAGLALHAGNLTVGSGIMAARLRARGEVRLTGARVTATGNLESAVLDNPGGPALTATVCTVGLDLIAASLRSTGEVRFRGARIAGRLDLSGATLSASGAALSAEDSVPDARGAAMDAKGTALNADGCAAGELSLRGAAPVGGRVSLRRAQAGVLEVEPGTWPDEVALNGLTYGSLLPHLPARERLPVLDRDGDGYVPHAYEQLAAEYARIGDDDSARRVRLARQRRHRRTLPWYGRAWGHLQDATVGYGYRPMRAATWLAALLVAGTLAFGLHHPPPLDAGKAPGFNPLVYTLDLLVPIADFGQASAYAPQGAYQWLSYLLVAAGWLLATTVLAGITRTINRP